MVTGPAGPHELPSERSPARRSSRQKGAPAFRTILVGMDGSHEANLALNWARTLAKEHDANVVVASAFTAPNLDASAGAYGYLAGYAATFTDQRDALREVADSAAETLRQDGIQAEAVVTIGGAAHELAEIAKTHRADLVILGSRHHGAIGSTGDAILDRVPSSILIARSPPPVRNILVATDGSHPSSRAVAYALREAEAESADVTIVHVVEYPDTTDDVPTPGFLRDIIARMQLDPPPRVRYRIESGRPAERIVAKGDEIGADLIVVGSRGMGRVRGWLLGSVSRRVVAHANASVLVVKDA